jgi:glycosyltransferase involved in cell wall biosynthesis
MVINLAETPSLRRVRFVHRPQAGDAEGQNPERDAEAGSGAESARPVYSAIMPATDRPATKSRCVRAILDADDPPDELIVVDRPAGMGPAAARNAGAALAKGLILVFVDSDVLVHRDVFKRIRAAFETEPELAAVFGSYDDRPSTHGVVSTFRNMLHHYVHQSSGGVATTFWAGLGAVRKEAFIAVDGFDDWRFRSPSVEDIELGLRLASAGGLIRLDPEIQGTHLKRWRFGTMLLTDLLYRGMPWTGLMLDRGPKAARLNLRGSSGVAAGAFSIGLLATLLGRPRVGAPLAAVYFALNTRFYALLHRRAGLRAAAAGVLLLIVHNAAALGSAPLGVVAFASDRVRRSRHPAPRLVAYAPAAAEPPTAPRTTPASVRVARQPAAG